MAAVWPTIDKGSKYAADTVVVGGHTCAHATCSGAVW